MEWFYFITIAIAIILLIVMLTFIGMRMVGNKKGSDDDDAFPPIQNTCPDLWSSEKDDDGKIWCKIPDSANRGNLTGDDIKSYNPDDKTGIRGYDTRDDTGNWVNFNNEEWISGSDTTECTKSNWSRVNNIAWDGISNYNQCD